MSHKNVDHCTLVSAGFFYTVGHKNTKMCFAITFVKLDGF